jgi:hypothetical protein
VVSGGDQDVDLLSFLRLRDTAGAQFAELYSAELLDMVKAQLHAVADFLRSAEREQLVRKVDIYPFPMSAEQVVQFYLCAHLEMHVDQLERAIEMAESLGSVA